MKDTKEIKQYKEFIEIELSKLMESIAVTVGEHQRIMNKTEMDDFEKGRCQGIVLLAKDTLDNLKAFGYRIGIVMSSDKGEKND